MSTVPAVVMVKVAFFYAKTASGVFRRLQPNQALHYLSQLIEGYREGMSAPLLVLPESGGAWLKTCYDAQNDAMLDDDSTLQKPVRNSFRLTKAT